MLILFKKEPDEDMRQEKRQLISGLVIDWINYVPMAPVQCCSVVRRSKRDRNVCDEEGKVECLKF